MLNYTSRAEMESCFSIAGIDSRLDDDRTDGEFVNSTEETYLDDVGYEATDICNQYLLTRYEPQAIQNVRWVRRTASYIACYLLSARRGNPKQFVSHYKQALANLNSIMEGHRPIFDENGRPVRVRTDFAPAHSNLVVDDRYARRKLRTQRTSSSGGSHEAQDVDYRVPWGS